MEGLSLKREPLRLKFFRKVNCENRLRKRIPLSLKFVYANGEIAWRNTPETGRGVGVGGDAISKEPPPAC